MSIRIAFCSSKPIARAYTTAPNLTAGNYRLIFQKTGFGSLTREPVEVRPRADVRVDVTLQPGAVSESVTVTEAAPLLDTNSLNNAAGFKQDLIQELPVIVVGTKRDVTGFLNNLPWNHQREYIHAQSQRGPARCYRDLPRRCTGQRAHSGRSLLGKRPVHGTGG